MKPKAPVVVLALLLVCAAGVFWHRSLLSKLRGENQRLWEIAGEVQMMREENAELTRTRTGLQQEIQRARADNQDLLKMRNEVARLRDQAKELDRLRSEVQRLRGMQAAGSTAATNSAELESFARKQFEMIEYDDSTAAAWALRAIPLIEAGENQKAIQDLARPIGMYYRHYKPRAATEERSNLLVRIEEAARRNPIIAQEIARKTE